MQRRHRQRRLSSRRRLLWSVPTRRQYLGRGARAKRTLRTAVRATGRRRRGDGCARCDAPASCRVLRTRRRDGGCDARERARTGRDRRAGRARRRHCRLRPGSALFRDREHQMIDRQVFLTLWLGDRSEENRASAIAAHRYLCVRAARKFVRSGTDRCDLEQVAALGLIKAVDRYDGRGGAPFEAYAWVLIVGELMHYVRDSERLLRVPRRVRELERRWYSAQCELRALLGREPSESEVIQFLGIRLDEAHDVLRCRENAQVLSFEALRPSEWRSLAYTIDDAPLDRAWVARALRTLTPL